MANKDADRRGGDDRPKPPRVRNVHTSLIVSAAIFAISLVILAGSLKELGAF